MKKLFLAIIAAITLISCTTVIDTNPVEAANDTTYGWAYYGYTICRGIAVDTNECVKHYSTLPMVKVIYIANSEGNEMPVCPTGRKWFSFSMECRDTLWLDECYTVRYNTYYDAPNQPVTDYSADIYIRRDLDGNVLAVGLENISSFQSVELELDSNFFISYI